MSAEDLVVIALAIGCCVQEVLNRRHAKAQRAHRSEMAARISAAIAEVAFQRKVDMLAAEAMHAVLRERIAAMQPVVDAVVRWDDDSGYTVAGLKFAVDGYRASMTRATYRGQSGQYEDPARGATETLIEAACHIPHGFMLRIEQESGEECGKDRVYLTASVYQHAPGWEPGDVFDEDDPDHGWSSARHPEDRFRDRVLFAITSDTPKRFERLVVGTILNRWPTPTQGLAAWKEAK
jgi:hypothetical protein